MPIIPPDDHRPWRNPHGNRSLATVRHADDGTYEVVVSPGADARDLIGAAANLPNAVVYIDHRAEEPGSSAAVLVFRGLPSETGGVPSRPAPGGPPASGWLPDVPGAGAGGVGAALARLVRAARR